ncbi:hypothetical protein SDC9_174772 [bioreactor metagenome]|uniref:Uncharacterized protein n=1 Tax=bioreactor metagenome TaxID=1076179 RepID=A0A645GK50_9ZZZZ
MVTTIRNNFLQVIIHIYLWRHIRFTNHQANFTRQQVMFFAVIDQVTNIEEERIVVENNKRLTFPYCALHFCEFSLAVFTVAFFTIAMSAMNRMFVWFVLTFSVSGTSPARHLLIISPKATMAIYPAS